MLKLKFKDLQNWFGDRGVELDRGDMAKWGNDDKYIWWVPKRNGLNSFFSSEYGVAGKTVLWVPIWSLGAEVENEALIEEVIKDGRFVHPTGG